MELAERPRCADCDTVAPETNTEVTLLSATGWRLDLRARKNGDPLLWRCPACWKSSKMKAGTRR
jgi:hypothetical protein